MCSVEAAVHDAYDLLIIVIVLGVSRSVIKALMKSSKHSQKERSHPQPEHHLSYKVYLTGYFRIHERVLRANQRTSIAMRSKPLVWRATVREYGVKDNSRAACGTWRCWQLQEVRGMTDRGG